MENNPGIILQNGADYSQWPFLPAHPAQPSGVANR